MSKDKTAAINRVARNPKTSTAQLRSSTPKGGGGKGPWPGKAAPMKLRAKTKGTDA